MFRETGSLCLYLVSHLGKSTEGLGLQAKPRPAGFRRI